MHSLLAEGRKCVPADVKSRGEGDGKGGVISLGASSSAGSAEEMTAIRGCGSYWIVIPGTAASSV